MITRRSMALPQSARISRSRLVSLGTEPPIFLRTGGCGCSRDAARNWQPLDPAPGQLVQSYQLSPDYGDDATVVAAVAGGGFFQTSLAPDAFPSSDPADSSGVLVSTDGGDTWTQLLSSGLAVDDQPYLAVQRIFLSPAYPKDGTMFAFAWGDPSQSRPFGTPVAAMKRALFRSVDGGASWDVVAVDGPLPFPTVQQLAFSPDFAHDGVMLWARNDKPSSPASGSCRLRRSSDRGLTWTSVLKTTFQYSYCQDPGFSSVQGKTLAHVSVTAREQWSDDAGQTWVPFQLGPYLAGLVSSAPTAARSGSILVGFRPRDGSGGLFALGTGLPPSNGALPCAQPIVAGFARVFQQDAHLRNWLGCPLAPEHNTPIRVWHDHPASGDLTPLAGRRLAELRRPHSRCIPRERRLPSRERRGEATLWAGIPVQRPRRVRRWCRAAFRGRRLPLLCARAAGAVRDHLRRLRRRRVLGRGVGAVRGHPVDGTARLVLRCSPAPRTSRCEYSGFTPNAAPPPGRCSTPEVC